MFPNEKFVDTNGIRMAFYEQGQGPAVILLHGFPELAFSWRYQLPALADAGFRAIAPDQRGYGLTTVPPAVADYRVSELIADVHGLMDALELESATFVGHDWGALVLWHMAMLAPQRMERLVALNIPHFPRSPVDPIAYAREHLGEDFYIVNFQDSDEADRLFGENPRRFIDRIMRKNLITREQFDQRPPERQVVSLLRIATREPGGDPILGAKELDYFAAAFERTGFTGGINWYRNWTHNWQQLDGIDQQIDIPTLFIGATDDIVVRPEHIERMRPLVSNLEVHMLEGCSHWSQQERAEDVNRIMLDWLRRE